MTKSSIHYMDIGHKEVICKVDGFVQCSINGPEKVLVEKIIYKLMITM